jgi:hypothetical protein
MTTITISLPAQIARRIDTEAKSGGFATRSEFIRSLLRKYFAKEQLEFKPFGPRPLEEIRTKLAQTGKYNQQFIDSVIKGLSSSSFYER